MVGDVAHGLDAMLASRDGVVDTVPAAAKALQLPQA